MVTIDPWALKELLLLLIAFGTVVGACYRWLVVPIRQTVRDVAEVKHHLTVNGSEGMLPERYQRLPLRSVVIRHIADSMEWRAQYETKFDTVAKKIDQSVCDIKTELDAVKDTV